MNDLTREISTWRVLAVDDKPTNLKLIGIVLKSAGAEVLALDDSEQVFAAVDAFKPNLILLDLAMPGISGWELQEQLRAKPELNQTPIIAVSALAMQSDIERAERAGFDGYITKPFHVDEVRLRLVEFVEAFIGR
jgi:two-component system, cell cycle response regulator DivK